MTVNERIVSALSDLAPVSSDINTDKVKPLVYYVFTVRTRPYQFEDNAPTALIHDVLVNLFCPHNFDSFALRRETAERLFAAGFTYPADIDGGLELFEAGNGGTQRRIFECEYAEVR